MPPASAEGPVIVATGPLTSDALSAEIAAFVGSEHLYFYDAISPIVLAESLDRTKVFRASRWDRSFRSPGSDPTGADPVPSEVRPRWSGVRCRRRTGRLSELPALEGRVRALLRRAGARGVGNGARLRQGAVLRGLPADRSDGASRPGYAALRSNEAGRAHRSAHRTLPVRRGAAASGHAGGRSLQSRRLSDAAQMGRAVARAAADSGPRAGGVRALRHGPPQHLHQRTDGPAGDVADAPRPDLFFAGQVSGVEGYVESAASGLVAGINAARSRPRRGAARAAAHDGDRRARATTCHTRIRRTISRRNITFGIMPPLEQQPRSSSNARRRISARALADLEVAAAGRRAHDRRLGYDG